MWEGGPWGPSPWEAGLEGTRPGGDNAWRHWLGAGAVLVGMLPGIRARSQAPLPEGEGSPGEGG